ncbi:hypothetical protein PR048_016287 [Dryococelus australis]|uniref:Uncharacterized protein n=1 Tax=Dryococelus australis TaxID=614101 RepID=A0ABQ9HJA6_9NEOP|nr:hypothetical protein PR048_016287 [Dryococelus australis]
MCDPGVALRTNPLKHKITLTEPDFVPCRKATRPILYTGCAPVPVVDDSPSITSLSMSVLDDFSSLFSTSSKLDITVQDAALVAVRQPSQQLEKEQPYVPVVQPSWVLLHVLRQVCPRSVRTVRLEEVIRQHTNDVPSTSTRSIVRQMGLSHSAVWDVLQTLPLASGFFQGTSVPTSYHFTIAPSPRPVTFVDAEDVHNLKPPKCVTKTITEMKMCSLNNNSML